MANTSKLNLAKLNRTWWGKSLLAGLFLGLSYGFASWGIDSGNLLHYAAAIGLLYFAATSLLKAIRLAL